jgi:hypothetical protein
MASYRVQFFKVLLSSDGHRFKCPQGSIEIANALDPDDAIRVAWLQYDQATKGSAHYYADLAEAELVEAVAAPT